MTINSNGLPIHANATINIRPRLFLEGNYYVDLQPGTPSAPTLLERRHAARRQHQRAGPARPGAVGAELEHPRQPADAAARLRRGAQRRADGGAGRHPGSDPARADRGPVAQPDRSTTPPRPSRPRRSSTRRCSVGSRTTCPEWCAAPTTSSEGWRRRRPTWRIWSSSFNATMGALAARQQDLSETIALLPPLLRATNSALGPIQASFGPTQAFARDLAAQHQAARPDDRRRLSLDRPVDGAVLAAGAAAGCSRR